MSHTYYSILVHCIFSTKERKQLITADLKERLWPYIAGIARLNQFKAIAVGGMPDHAHVLLSLPTAMPVAKAVQLIKGGSSKWMNDHLRRRPFAWQDGYAAFSIGVMGSNGRAIKIAQCFSRPLKGTRVFHPFPAVETAGYSHTSRERDWI